MSEAAILTTETDLAPTPLAASLQTDFGNINLQPYAGALTAQTFSSAQQELNAALSGSVVADLGYRTRIRITGPDRLRWLNGMVTNTIPTLTVNHGNYNFILNAQGRIQGDAYIYRTADALWLDTDRSQAPRLLAHLDHFIIMDDVELQPLDDVTTGIMLRGPKSAAILDALGMNASNLAQLELTQAMLQEVPVTLVHSYDVLAPCYELWFPPEHTSTIWTALVNTGAQPAGIQAVEALRILEGTPRYGVDITDRHLAQETSQDRALNFTKGCYLGQEIVERIRSRATIHRSFRQFALDGESPALPADLCEAENPAAIGQLTSAANIQLPNFIRTVALGFLRNEVAERKSRIEYHGGVASILSSPAKPPVQ